jgi:hypothetical protein
MFLVLKNIGQALWGSLYIHDSQAHCCCYRVSRLSRGGTPQNGASSQTIFFDSPNSPEDLL